MQKQVFLVGVTPSPLTIFQIGCASNATLLGTSLPDRDPRILQNEVSVVMEKVTGVDQLQQYVGELRLGDADLLCQFRMVIVLQIGVVLIDADGRTLGIKSQSGIEHELRGDCDEIGVCDSVMVVSHGLLISF